MLFDASATALGSSSASAFAVILVTASGTFVGSSSSSSSAGVNHLSSAFFEGGSSFEWDYLIEAEASFAGSSSATADAHTAVGASAFFHGGSFFLYGTLLPIQGSSFFVVSAVVDVHLPPIRAITMGPKTFRWLQTLQRGDLPVFICDASTPMIPARITYRLAQVRLDGTRKYVGPQNRTPVPGNVGEFYATGRAGESGQPGLWVIEWLYQRTYQSDVQRTEMPFQVLDAVAAGDPREQLDRKIKFGWS
jgi:hypothetical protein